MAKFEISDREKGRYMHHGLVRVDLSGKEIDVFGRGPERVANIDPSELYKTDMPPVACWLRGTVGRGCSAVKMMIINGRYKGQAQNGSEKKGRSRGKIIPIDTERTARRISVRLGRYGALDVEFDYENSRPFNKDDPASFPDPPV